MEFPGVAVVIGAGGSGIGAAVAEAFVRRGCTRVAITDINVSTLEATQGLLQGITAAVEILISVGDISSEEFVNSFLKLVSQRFGRIDYAVNCAGILGSVQSRSKATPTMEKVLQEKVLQTPLKRAGTAKEVADSVMFLCSDKATFIQGHALVVDGGYTIA